MNLHSLVKTVILFLWFLLYFLQFISLVLCFSYQLLITNLFCSILLSAYFLNSLFQCLCVCCVLPQHFSCETVERVQFKVAVLVYKTLEGLARHYLGPLIHVADLPG